MSSFTEDTPPNSRLFIVCSKKDNLSEKDFQDAFSKYGAIEDVWFVRDKRSGSARGLCYVKFSKSSEACRAMEEMNGKSIANSDKPLKIIIAANRNEGNVRKTKEGESINRIFVVVPLDATADSIKRHFEKFGVINDILMVRNNKFAYLTFSRSSEAALALEGCDRLTYKPRIADPPGFSKKRPREPSYSPPPYRRDNYVDDYSPPPLPRRYPEPVPPPMPMPVSRSMYPSDGGMIDLTLAYIKYETAASAAWAWEKLQDFEYPPGYLIRVRYADAGFPADWQAELSLTTGFHYQSSLQSGPIHSSGRSSVPEQRSYGGDNYNGHGSASSYGQGEMSSYATPKNSVKLGPPKPILGRGVVYADRVFVVCTNRIPMNVMEDAFSSFGDLIEFYYIANKNYGYATYASAEAAEKAINTLNGEMLYGERIKVVRAEPEPNKDTKR